MALVCLHMKPELQNFSGVVRAAILEYAEKNHPGLYEDCLAALRRANKPTKPEDVAADVADAFALRLRQRDTSH